MSEPNEAVERVRLVLFRQMKRDVFECEDIESLLAEREILRRKAAAFDAMVEHGWFIHRFSKNEFYITTVVESGSNVARGATPLEAVECAVKGLEGR